MAIEINGLEGIFERLEGIVDSSTIECSLKQACALIEGEAVKKAPKSIQPTITSKIEDLTGIVFTPLWYAPYVEYGTGIHAEGKGGGRTDVPWVFVEGSGQREGKSSKTYTLETAKQAMAMLRQKGLPAFYTYGQKPQPYMRPALDENREKVLEILGRSIIEK